MVAAVNPHCNGLVGGAVRCARESRNERVRRHCWCAFRHQNRIKEIADVLARYGFARLADHAAAALDTGLRATLVTRIADRISLP